MKKITLDLYISDDHLFYLRGRVNGKLPLIKPRALDAEHECEGCVFNKKGTQDCILTDLSIQAKKNNPDFPRIADHYCCSKMDETDIFVARVEKKGKRINLSWS